MKGAKKCRIVKAHNLENESELASGCRAGKRSAREELYTRYSKQLLAVCFRYTGDMDAAHDVLHDGFVKIFTKFSYRGESSLPTWLTKVMMMQALDYLRKQKRINSVEINEELASEADDIADINEDERDDLPDEKQLLQFVAELPDGCRTVFNLFVFEQKSHKEIAELLHIKEHTSTSQFFRAKSILSKRIKASMNHEK